MAAVLPDPDPAMLKKLRLRIDTDHPQYHGNNLLKIRGRDLNDLPLEIFQLTELEVLDLSPEREACINYRIGRLPPGLGNLTSLRILMLDTNELDELPQELCLLTLLEKLSLSNNYLRRLPEGFERLRRLEALYLANNRFHVFPAPICLLLQLRYLDLSDNLIEELPPSIARLQRLESLLLVYNRLSKLPDSICEMASLHMLWVGYNRLRRLPITFHRLVNLDWGVSGHTTSLAIDGNPLIDPPVDVARQGVFAIGEYMSMHGGRIVVTPAPPLAPDGRSSRLVTSALQPLPPQSSARNVVVETRSYTPLVEIRPRPKTPVTAEDKGVGAFISTPEPFRYDLTYYGSNAH